MTNTMSAVAGRDAVEAQIPYGPIAPERAETSSVAVEVVRQDTAQQVARIYAALSKGSSVEDADLKMLEGMEISGMGGQPMFRIQSAVNSNSLAVEALSPTVKATFGDGTIWLRRSGGNNHGVYRSQQKDGKFLALHMENTGPEGYVEMAV